MPVLRSAVPDNMVASQDGPDVLAPSGTPEPVTKPLRTAEDGSPSPLGAARTSLALKVKGMVQAEVDAIMAPLLNRIEFLEAQLSKRQKDDFFTTAEVTAFAFNLEPTEIPMWLSTHFLPAVLGRNPRVH